MADTFTGTADLTLTATVAAKRRTAYHGSASLTIRNTAFSGPVSGDLLEQCSKIWDATRRQRRAEEELRHQAPFGRLWSAEWELHFLLGNERKGTFSWISNDTGPGQLELPFESPAAQWIHDHQGRIDRGEGRNVGITVDYCGARWGGLMDKYHIETREDGDRVLVVDFNHDYEHL